MTDLPDDVPPPVARAAPAPPRPERPAGGRRGWVVADRRTEQEGDRAGPVRLSVVVAVRDRVDTVAGELAVILARVGPDDEVVVIDDASTDDTLAAVRTVDDPRLRTFGLVARRGRAWATDLGLLNAWGRLVALPPAPDRAVGAIGGVEDVLAADALAGITDGSGVVGWREALLGRVGFLDIAVRDPHGDLATRVRQAFVSRLLVDHDGPSTAADGPVRDLGPDDPGPVAFPPHTAPVSVTLASVPWRRDHLERVVRGLLPQVDHLGVYLNGYDDVPAVLEHPRIWVARSQDHGDRRDNGKFFFAARLPRGHHLTVDDDIDYPSDHVAQLVARVEQYDRRAVVGLHGVVVSEPVTSYFGSASRSVRHFSRPLAVDEAVHVLGTGTTAMHTDALRLGPDDLPTTGMADVWLAVAAHARGIPLVAVSRPDATLRPLPDDGPTLFNEFHQGDEAHVEALRSVTLGRPDVLARPFPAAPGVAASDD